MIKVEIFDGSDVTADEKIYQTKLSQNNLNATRRFNKMQAIKPVIFEHREWTLRFTSMPSFGAQINPYIPVIVLMTGVFLSLFCLAAFLYLKRAKNYAELIAFERAHDLAKSKARLNLILNNAGDGILGLNKQGEITFANKMVEDILGYEVDRILGVSKHKIFHVCNERVASVTKEHCDICKKLPSLEIHTADNEVFWHKEGHSVAVEYTPTPIKGDNDEITGFVVVFRDITARKKMQNDLIVANAELEEFSYRTSHDLRSPLMSAIGLMDFTRQSIETQDEKVAIETLDMAQGSLKKIRDVGARYFTAYEGKKP